MSVWAERFVRESKCSRDLSKKHQFVFKVSFFIKNMVLKKSSSITLVELPATQFGRLDGEPSRDVYSLFGLPARGLHQIAGVLEQEGFTDVQVINPIYHGRNRRLTPENWERITHSDVLGGSAITRTSPQTLELGARYKVANPKGMFWLGGSDSKFRAKEYVEKGADIVFKGEAEETLREVVHVLQDSGDLQRVRGIAFRNGGGTVENLDRDFMTPEQLARVHPIYDAQTIKGVKAGVVETARGCPYDCNFCSVTQNYGSTYRVKPIDYSVEEFRRALQANKIVFATADNFAGKMDYTKQLLEAILQEGSIRKDASLQMQITAGATKDHRFLELARKVGFNTTHVGLEAISDASLKAVGKAANSKMNQEAVRTLREFGFWVHGMFTPWTEEDNFESTRELLEWAKENVDSAQFFPVTPLPGTPLDKRVREEERILTNDFSLYDCQHVVYRRKTDKITPYQMQLQVYKMYEEFYSAKECTRRLARAPKGRKGAASVITAYALLGGFKQVLYDEQSLQHLEFLRSLK